ncbi:MAG: hypothetical protein RMI00_06545 [Sulfolobales archaeon]|nr:hypothetical protein [Sulfolobales archaeon]
MEKQKKGRVVGVASHPGACPMAAFLREELGMDRPVVGGTTFVTHPGGEGFYLPGWARRTIELVDAYGDGYEVTAEDVLDILRWVVGEGYSLSEGPTEANL